MNNTRKTPQEILVPVDFSVYDQETIDLAAQLCRLYGSRMTVVHVVEPLSAYFGAMFYGMTPGANKERQERLESVVPTVQDVNLRHIMLRADDDALTVSSEIAEEITEFALQEKVDLIVMSSHGRKSLSDVLVGGVTEHVMRQAPCTMITVKSVAHVEKT
ncbi:MAG: universal stress protein [Planctomycetales bacterium]|nr:universal stress protein [Planctomycetales bacterium]